MRLHTLALLQKSEVYQSWTLARKPRGPHHLGFHTVAGGWGALDALQATNGAPPLVREAISLQIQLSCSVCLAFLPAHSTAHG